MLETNKYYLTDKGNEIIRRAISGEQIDITSVKIGTGVLPEDEDEARALTALVLPRQSFLINNIVTKNGQAKISVAMRNDTLTTGYYAREAGLYAKDPDTQEETLFAVAKLDGNFIPAYSGANVVNQQYSLYIVIGDANVTIKYEGDLYQLKSEALTMEEVIDSLYPVGSIYLAFGDKNPNELWPSTQWQAVAGGTALLTAGDDYTAGTVYGANAKAIARENLPKEKVNLEIASNGAHTHYSVNGFTEIGFDTTNGGGESGGGDPSRIAYGDNRPYHNLRRSAITSSAGGHTHSGTTAELGAGTEFNVMQASLAINAWQRIA